MTHILIPREPSMNLLRPFIECPTSELDQAWAAMVRIAEVQHARAGSQCLAQIEEPAAPAAVAPQGVVAWMHPETLNVISAAHKHDMSTEYGAETRRKAESYSVALVRAGEPAAAAPALEAPAAPVGSARQFIEWMYSQPEDREPTTAEGALLEFEAHLAAAAPQAPAAPWKDHKTARLVNDLRDCAIKYHGAGQLRERIAHIVVPLCDQLKGALAAPAAPAVDALDSDRWRALEGQMDAGRVSLTVHHTEAEQWDGRTISDAGELQDYADSLAAQAKEGGDQ